jgi:hypothetical protein
MRGTNGGSESRRIPAASAVSDAACLSSRHSSGRSTGKGLSLEAPRPNGGLCMRRVGIPFHPLYNLRRRQGVDTGQSWAFLSSLRRPAQRPGSAARGYGKDHRVGRNDRLAGSHRIGRAKGVGWVAEAASATTTDAITGLEFALPLSPFSSPGRFPAPSKLWTPCANIDNDNFGNRRHNGACSACLLGVRPRSKSVREHSCQGIRRGSSGATFNHGRGSQSLGSVSALPPFLGQIPPQTRCSDLGPRAGPETH